MIVNIYDWGHGSYDDYKYDWHLGLKYDPDISKTYIANLYEVIDKQVFMLAIIKHGLKYTVLKH